MKKILFEQASKSSLVFIMKEIKVTNLTPLVHNRWAMNKQQASKASLIFIMEEIKVTNLTPLVHNRWATSKFITVAMVNEPASPWIEA